ncbi:DUF6153 family protein [Pseudarthrobacter oxydans]|jgi:hypothetical protein|uniref:DUF6153 family protein n=1 Tax=Pseudarthrobacter oxydans TaxID=1671 RepID=UPI00344BB36C
MRRGQTHPISAFLARVASVVGVLGIILGVLGMHVTTAQHSAPLTATGPDGPYVISASSPHSFSGQTTVHEVSKDAHLHDPAAQTLCAEIIPCPEMGHFDSACVPVPGVTAWAAPQPGLSPLQVQLQHSFASPELASTFGPCPSLSELSISRT